MMEKHDKNAWKKELQNAELCYGRERDCVLNAVNPGGDTDSVAVVCGGLAGALYGIEGIPKKLLDKLIRREYIEEHYEKASIVWKKQ